MKKPDPRVDAYIHAAPEFARPILEKIRNVFHKADPAIEENIKWGNPTFEHNGIVGGMGAFKKHVAFGFWNAPAMKDPEDLFANNAKKSPYAIKASTLKDLPTERVLVAYVKEAVKLNAAGIKRAGAPAKKTPAPKAPTDLVAAFKKNKKAHTTFEGFSPSRQREYVEWITKAKREATRLKRVAQAIEWMAEGKPRNWKYDKKWGGSC